jgi:hypothetical protein
LCININNMNVYRYTKSTPPLICSDTVANKLRTQDLSVCNPITGYFTSWKKPVRVATTAEISLIGIQTIDGVLLSEYDRVLVKNQPNNLENNVRFSNGIYVARTTNWDRADDCLDGTSSDGLFTYVIAGSINNKRFYYCTTPEGTIGATYLQFLSLSITQQPVGPDGAVQYNNLGAFYGSNALLFEDLFSNVNLKIGVSGYVNKIVSAPVTGSQVNFNIKSGDGVEANGGDMKIQTGLSTGNSGNITVFTGASTLYDLGNVNMTAVDDLSISIGNSTSDSAFDINFTTGLTNGVSLDSGIFMTSGLINLNTTSLVPNLVNIQIVQGSLSIPTASVSNSSLTASINFPQGFITIDTNGLGGIAASSSVVIVVTNPYIYANSLVLSNIQSYAGTGTPTTSVTSVSYVSEYNNTNSFSLKISNVNITNVVNTSLVVGFIIL